MTQPLNPSPGVGNIIQRVPGVDECCAHDKRIRIPYVARVRHGLSTGTINFSMDLQYKPGQKLILKGEMSANATVVMVSDHMIVLRYDDVNEETTIHLENLRKMEKAGAVELINH
jgi:hypothetical protein